MTDMKQTAVIENGMIFFNYGNTVFIKEMIGRKRGGGIEHIIANFTKSNQEYVW